MQNAQKNQDQWQIKESDYRRNQFYAIKLHYREGANKSEERQNAETRKHAKECAAFLRKVDWYGKNKNEERVYHASGWADHAGTENEYHAVHDPAQMAVFSVAAGCALFYPVPLCADGGIDNRI